MKTLSALGAAIVILAACTQGEITPALSPESLVQSCKDAGFEPNTAEFSECEKTLGEADLIRARVRALRGG